MGLHFKIEIKGLDELLKRMSEAEPIIKKELGAAMSQTTNEIRSEIIKIAPLGATGHYKRSIGSSVSYGSGSKIIGRVGANAEKAPYAAVVEFGSKPHWAPIAPILLWVHRKLIAATEFHVSKSGQRVRSGGKARQQREDEAVAYAIREGIHLRGTKAQHIIQRAFDKVKPRINGYFEKARDRIVDALNK